MRNLVLLFVLGMVQTACSSDQTSSLPYFSQADLSPIWVSAGDFEETEFRRVSNFSFLDQKNEVVSDESLRGTPYVASFFFVDCTNVCPTLKSRLSVVQQHFDPIDLHIVSHSVAPLSDSVEKLAAYSQVNEIDTRQWHLVTGEPGSIYKLATEQYGAQLTNQTGQRDASSEFLHTEILYLVDGEGFIRGLYNGTLALEVDRLMEDAAVLIRE